MSDEQEKKGVTFPDPKSAENPFLEQMPKRGGGATFFGTAGTTPGADPFDELFDARKKTAVSPAVLTKEEEEVLRLLAEAYGRFVELDVIHAWDQREFMQAIHAAQYIVLARPAARSNEFVVNEQAGDAEDPAALYQRFKQAFGLATNEREETAVPVAAALPQPIPRPDMLRLGVRPKLTENEARYIVRMLDGYTKNTLFTDSTDEDSQLMDIMRPVNGGGQSDAEAMKVWLIMHVAKHGVPGGEYLLQSDYVDRLLAQHGTPKIQRPS